MKGHRIKTTQMVLAVSFFVLFFCASCGIPQFCNLLSTNLKGTSQSEGSINLELSSSRDEEDLEAKVTGGPYIAFFYTVSKDQLTSTERKNVSKAFEDQFGKGSNAKKQISIYSGRAVVSSVNLCAFSIGEGSLVSAPTYHLDSNQNGKLRADYSAEISMSSGKILVYDGLHSLVMGRYDVNQVSFPDSIEEVLPTYSDMSAIDQESTSYHINIFAAFTVVGQFTNNYWSELTYLGDFTVDFD